MDELKQLIRRFEEVEASLYECRIAILEARRAVDRLEIYAGMHDISDAEADRRLAILDAEEGPGF